MLSQITGRLLYMFKTSNLFSGIIQSSDNSIIFSILGFESWGKFKITITKVKE
jgi:hypothetical protein